jgi:hypothetical protein
MKHQWIRILISVLASFVALTAISGGVILFKGTYQNGMLIEWGGQGQFPVAWLHDTPFTDYTIPALILIIVVGGGSLFSAFAIFRRNTLSFFASGIAGLLLMGWIIGEVFLLKQPSAPTGAEIMYGGVGIILFGFSLYLWRTESPARAISQEIKNTETA